MLSSDSIAKNLLWRLAERVGAQGVNFIVALVLARILSPDDFGLVSIITVFIAIMQVFVDSGLGNALIQKQDVDELDFSTVFVFNCMICIVLYFIVYLTSPFIAEFYNNCQLVPIIRVLGLTILISGVKNIQQAYVSKHMLFKKFFFSTLGGTLFSAVIGIMMALRGYGVWSLVAQQLINSLIDTLILWITVEWRPIKKVSIERFKSLFSFGWKLLLSSLLETVYNNSRTLIIGKMYSTADLAYYNKANQFPSFLVTNTNSAIDSVLFPSMASVQDDKNRVKAILRRSIRVTGFVVWPLMVGLAVISPTLVRVLLTEKWLPSVPYIRLFCIYYAFWPIHTTNLNAIKAIGRSDLFLKLEVIKKIVGIIALASSIWFGPMAIAFALTITAPVSAIINANPNRSILNYGILDQIFDISASISASIFMGGTVLCITLLQVSDIIRLFLQVATGFLSYYFFAKILNRETLNYYLDLVKRIVNGK